MKIELSVSKAYNAQTPAERAKFERWFGKSVVRDKSGEPLRCFHGTPKVFQEFDSKFVGTGVDQYGIGYYFTGDPNMASTYAKNKLDKVTGKPVDEEENGNVMPVYLRINKPIDFYRQPRITRTQVGKLLTGLGRKNLERFISDNYDVDFEGMQKCINEYADACTGNDLVHASLTIWSDLYEGHPQAGHFPEIFAGATGYDGIVARRSGADVYVVFSPLQIKSAVGNSGRYRRVADITD